MKYISYKIALLSFAGFLIAGWTGLTQGAQANQSPQDYLALLEEQGVPANVALPEHGLQDAINWLGTGDNNISSYLYGENAINPFTGESNAENAPNPQAQPVYKQFAGTRNPLIKVQDPKHGTTRFVEVLYEGPDGGRGRYEDDAGILGEIVWNQNREIKNDEHSRSLVGQKIGNPETEPAKSLRDSLGSTATLVMRNGRGGITEQSGDFASQLYQVKHGLNTVSEALSANAIGNIKVALDTLIAQTIRLDNRVGNVEESLKIKENESLMTKVNRLQDIVEKMSFMVYQICLATPCLKCKYVNTLNIHQVDMTESWIKDIM